MKKNAIFVLSCLGIIVFSLYVITRSYASSDVLFHVRSIDTMKLSRDNARAALNDPTYDATINDQMGKIAAVGASHVAIATPYDKEFLPILRRWVESARRHNLHVWFRGNFSGWEQWFNYPAMGRKEHTEKTKEFILANQDLFKDGDIFTSCPECENGGPGDPRETDLEGFRKFLIEEYTTSKQAFESIHRQVTANYYSMNGDVALLVMDKPMTKALGGVVTIDHYVETPEKMRDDIIAIAKHSGGKIVLGEIGVPIPDINGTLTNKEQAEWLAKAFGEFQNMPELIGMNYWVSTGGTTALWPEDNEKKDIVTVLKRFYTGKTIPLTVTDAEGNKIVDALLMSSNKKLYADKNGIYHIPYFYTGQKVSIFAKGYRQVDRILTDVDENSLINEQTPIRKLSWWRSFLNFLNSL